jgi:hypothetical protein
LFLTILESCFEYLKILGFCLNKIGAKMQKLRRNKKKTEKEEKKRKKNRNGPGATIQPSPSLSPRPI